MPLLLALAFFLHGAKTEVAFSLWGLCALGCVAALISSPAYGQPRALPGPFLFLGGILLVQIFSSDRSASFFWTVQLAVMTVLWIALRWAPSIANSKQRLGIVFRITGVLSAVLTLTQMGRHAAPWGWLPANSDWNATWMAVIVVFLLADTFASRPHAVHSFADLGLVVILAVLVIVGPSRSAVLGMGFAVCWLIWQSPKVQTISLYRTVPLLLAVGLGLFKLPTNWARTSAEIQNGGRLDIWRTAVKSLLDRPLLGYGAGNFELAYLRHAPAITRDAVHYGRTTLFAHNEFLQMWVELGWPLGALLSLGVLTIGATYWGEGHKDQLAEKSALIVLACAAFFNPIFHLPLLTGTALLLAARILPPSTTPLTPSTEKWLKTSFLTITAILALALLGCGLRARLLENHRWRTLVALDPSDAEAWHRWGFEEESASKALHAQMQAVRHSPGQPYYQEALGRALESTGNTQDVARALQAYLNAVYLAPGRAINFLAIGRLLYREGDPDAALTWFEKARSLEPFYWESELWEARCRFALHEPARALRILDTLKRRHERFSKEVYLDHTLVPYEAAILGYDTHVVARQREWFLAKMRHS